MKWTFYNEQFIVLDRSDVRDLWLFSPILEGEGSVSLLRMGAIQFTLLIERLIFVHTYAGSKCAVRYNFSWGAGLVL